MTIFAEPSVTLCGIKAENMDAMCCIETRFHAGRAHVFISATEIFSRLSHTLTPCKWANRDD